MPGRIRIGMTMARAIAIVAFVFSISVVATTMILTEGRQQTAETATTETEENDNDNKNDGKSLLPFPKFISKKQRRRNGNSESGQNKELLSLLWSDGEASPFSFYSPPVPPKKNGRLSLQPNRFHHIWNFLWGRHYKDELATEQETFREDQEKIRATLKKFYRLADPKFARASLASVKNRQLPGISDDGTGVGQVLGNDGDELLPGTILQVYTKGDLFEEDDNDDENEEEGQERATSLLEEHAYELVERMQLELGATPKHYMDFAYRSVTASSSSSSTRSSSTGSSTKRRASGGDDLLISGSIVVGEDLPSCEFVIPTNPSAIGVGEANCKRNDAAGGTSENDSDSDRAMAFLVSWWKWWLPFANSQWWKNSGSSKADYDIGKSPFAGGSNGEVWRGKRICPPRSKKKKGWGWEDDEDEDEEDDCDDNTPLVLKRLRIERGYLLLEAGLREIYFGKLIARVLEETKQGMYTVYVDHFFREVPRRHHPSRAFAPNTANRGKDLELWIVYEDAGPSLRSYIYSPIVSENGFVMHQHSKLWTKLRTFAEEEQDEASDNQKKAASNNNKNKHNSEARKNRGRKLGRLFLQKTLRQVLAAAAELHKRGIVHRDIKPSNVMCRFDQPVSLEEWFDSETAALPNIVCRLGDFSSGWDRYTSEHLYTKGATPGEQTDEYAPPESYVGPYWKPFDESKPQSYDSWSIGVLALELLLGTPNVFTVDQRTSALLTVKLQRARASEEEIAYAMYLAALSNFCIFVPSNEMLKGDSWPLRYGDPLHKTAMVQESCTLQDFHRALRARDPLGIGFDSSTDLLLHLIWQLLAFDPSERMTAEEALRHPFFLSPDGTLESLNQIPGYHNALISEMLDARIDFDVQDEIKTFECPTCGRVFHDWSSCHQHANLRKHAKFCVYNHTVLPSCINTHAMLPEHPTSGYCDLQGRRKTIEDFHSIHLHHGHQFYGIFDGHTGNLAAKFAASELYAELRTHLPDLMMIEEKKQMNSLDSTIPVSGDNNAWKEEIRVNVTKAFETVHERFLDRITTMTSAISEVGSAPKMDQSGTTATALLVTNEVVIAAVLGDSRGVLASAKSKSTGGSDAGSSSASKSRKGKSQWYNFPEVSAIQFSIDHVASNPTERDLVLKRGGFVKKSGDTARVNGTLAITRSIGDANLAPVLSREPHVRAFGRSELRELCGDLGRAPSDQSEDGKNTNNSNIPCFAILASDGLWDVMSNQEAVDMVVEIILRHNEAHASSIQSGREVALFASHGGNIDDDDDEGGPFQESAERLAVEAYVRGSTDNIGVCVVAID